VTTFPASDDPTWTRPPLGLWGLGRSADGAGWISTGNQLVKVQPDGTWSVVADWPCLDDVEGTTACPIAVTVRATDGAVALFGAYGGLSLWTPADGLVALVPDDPDHATGEWNAARSDEQGGLFALGTVGDPQTTAVRGVFRYNVEQGSFVLRGPWLDSAGAPPGGFSSEWRFGGFDIDTVRGEYYVTANIGTNRRAIYRVFDGATDGYAALLWPDTFAATPGPQHEGREFGALAVRWTQE